MSSEDEDESLETEESLMEKNVQLQKAFEILENKNIEMSRIRSRGVILSASFLVSGIIILIISMFNVKELLMNTPLESFAPSISGNSQVLAFIGLGLVFWGGLFLLIRPVSYVKSEILDTTTLSNYRTLDRILKNLHIYGEGFYIPALQL